MNPAETAKYIAWIEEHKDVMKAYALGEEIQYNRGDEWIDAKPPRWTFGCRYRIKPKPVKVYGVFDSNGFVKAFNLKYNASSYAHHMGAGYYVVELTGELTK